MINPFNKAMNEIDLTTNLSYARGFICAADHEELSTYLIENGFNQSLSNKVSDQDSVCILQDLWVNDEKQGKGLGKKILKQFIDRAKDQGAKVIILLLDKAQPQREKFDLQEFYIKQGFQNIDSNWMIQVL